MNNLFELGQFPERQVQTYLHMNQHFPTRLISRGEQITHLPFGEPLKVQYTVDENSGQQVDCEAFMQRTRVSGLLVLHRGAIVLEKYALGHHADGLWTSFSVAKSITSMLVGAALAQGKIRSLDDDLTRYVARLKGSAYEGVSVRHALQMSSGIGWNEDYLDPNSNRRKMYEAQTCGRSGAVLDYLASLQRVAAPGERFNYSTGETYVVGQILVGATGQSLSDYLSQQLWGPLGMQSDAYWQLDCPLGSELAGSGICATLRDYGRLGLFMMVGGRIGDRQVLDQQWLREATDNDPRSPRAPGKLEGWGERGYGLQWWTYRDGHYGALGIFGQQILAFPEQQLLVVMHSAWPSPIDAQAIAETDRFIEAVKYGLTSI
jgi:CubicO group peptidase (beta-lactamase class C family)